MLIFIFQNFLTDPQKPASVNLRTSISNSTSALNVSWVPSSSIISIYNITLYSSQSTTGESKTEDSNSNFVVFTGLIPGESYTATVQSISSSVDIATTYSNISTSNDQRTSILFLFISYMF